MAGASRTHSEPRRRRRHARPISIRRSIYEWTAMALLLAGSTLGVILFGAVRNWSAGVLMALVFPGIALFLIRPFLDRELMEIRTPVSGLLLLIFFLYAVLVTPFAAVPYEARVELLKIASYIGAYWAWTEFASRYKRWRFLVGIPLFLGTLVAWYAIIQHAQGSTMVLNMERHEQYGMRASGTFMAPAHLGAYMGTMICLAACLVAMPSAGVFLRLLGGYGLVLFLPVLFLSESRSGWVGATLGLSVVCWMVLWRRNLRRFLMSLVLVPLMFALLFGALWVASPMFKQRVSDGLAVKGTAGHRILMWKDTLQMIKSEPVLGHGPGSYRWMHPPHKSWPSDLWLTFAHNEYLHLASDYGVVGAILLGAALAWCLLRLLIFYRKISRERDAYLIAGLVGALVASMGHAFFDFNYHVFALNHLLFLFAGVVMASLYASGDLTSRKVTPAGWALISLPLLVLTVMATLMSVQLTASDVLMRQGEKQVKQLDWNAAEATYERVIRLDPGNWLAHLELGNLYRRRGFWSVDQEYKEQRLHQALASFERALALNPQDMHAVYGLGKAYYQLGDEERSLAYLRQASDYWRYDAFFPIQLGLQLRQMGRYEEALEVFLEARTFSDDPLIDNNIRTLRRLIQQRNDKAPAP